jgi:hypothetical protein
VKKPVGIKPILFSTSKLTQEKIFKGMASVGKPLLYKEHFRERPMGEECEKVFGHKTSVHQKCPTRKG